MIIKRSDLNEVGSYYHSFESGGFTGVVALCESLVSIHTWPEANYVTIDVFTCNYSRDNSEAARFVFDKIAALFKPKSIRRQEVRRQARLTSISFYGMSSLLGLTRLRREP